LIRYHEIIILTVNNNALVNNPIQPTTAKVIKGSNKMKFSFPISLALALMGSVVEASVKPHKGAGAKLRTQHKQFKVKQDFMKAIHADGKLASAQRKKRENDRKRKLMDKLMAAATPRAEHEKRHRHLEQKNNEYSFDEYEWMNPVYQQMISDGVFDLTARSFKYSGCAAIKAYDPERGSDNGNPMVIDTYAVFRLCPEDTCNKYSLTGCGKNYGEYVVEMSTYLEFMLDFYENHYGAYCDYCYPCDYNYQIQKKQLEGQCYENMAMQDYQMQQDEQAMQWEDYYQNNFGDMSEYNQAKQQYQQQMQQQMNDAYQQQYQDAYNANSANGYNANNANGYNANRYNANNNGNRRKLEDYYKNFASYAQGGSSNNANNNANNANWQNGGQANGQAYYNMYNQQQQNANGQADYGYINEYGEYVDLCESNGYTDSDGREYNIDCSAYESKMMTCSDGNLCDYCEYQIDQTFSPCDQYVCKDYYTYCSDLYEPQYKQMYNNGNNNNNQQNNNNNNNNGEYNQQEQNSDLYQFLGCTAYVNEYGQQYYVGPHCGSDHYTISLGVFSDENCVNYLGETVSLSKVLGYGYDDESFFHLPHECISCDGAHQFQKDEERYQEMYHGQGVYGDYVEAPNEEFDDVVAMCAALFERSAQCNIHMTNYGMMSKYMDTIDAAFEQRYCNFIDNIVYGTYNEKGEIKLKAESFDFNDWRNPEQYKKMRMPVGQAVGLALSALLVIALSALAFVTQRALTRGGSPWRPRRAFKNKDLERQESGIHLGRSASGPVNPPLI